MIIYSQKRFEQQSQYDLNKIYEMSKSFQKVIGKYKHMFYCWSHKKTYPQTVLAAPSDRSSYIHTNSTLNSRYEFERQSRLIYYTPS